MQRIAGLSGMGRDDDDVSRLYDLSHVLSMSHVLGMMDDLLYYLLVWSLRGGLE